MDGEDTKNNSLVVEAEVEEESQVRAALWGRGEGTGEGVAGMTQGHEDIHRVRHRETG